MLKSTEWGAAAYLASSDYGAGIDVDGKSRVMANTSFPTTSYDEDGKSSQYGITGCGPYDEKGLTTTYSDGVTLNNGTVGNESPEACSSTVNERSCNGLVSRLSSSTNNLYGIYDMAGGTFEYAIDSYSDDADESPTDNFGVATRPPYVDIYSATVFKYPPVDWSDNPDYTGHYYYDFCIWETWWSFEFCHQYFSLVYIRRCGYAGR